MKISVIDEIHEEALEMLEGFELEQSGDIENSEAVVTKSWTAIDDDFLKRAKKLKYVVRCGVGVENIDLEACEERGIKVINSPGSNANSVAEHTVALILAMMKDVVNRHKNIGDWNRELVSELAGKKVGIIGLGAIGKLVAKKLAAFDVKLVGFDVYVKDKDFEEYGVQKTDLNTLLQDSDIITIHVPLTDKTENMLSSRELQLMSGKYLVNTSRGQVVDELALIESLKNGTIAGAALDVFHEEPFNMENGLSKLNNVILSPHISSMTPESYKRMCVEAVEKFLSELKSD